MTHILDLVSFPIRKLGNYTVSLNTLLESPLIIKAGITSKVEFVSSIVEKTVGACYFGKGAIDAAEAYMCQDGVCFAISCVGLCADTLTLATSYVPVVNATSLVTIPVSSCCKTFVWCCKRSLLPNGIC